MRACCLLTDVSVEEAGPYVKVMRAAGLDTVFLAAPTSTERRLQLVAEYSTGFVYLVSRSAAVSGGPAVPVGRPAVVKLRRPSVVGIEQH